jgi:hypothetical protein
MIPLCDAESLVHLFGYVTRRVIVHVFKLTCTDGVRLSSNPQLRINMRELLLLAQTISTLCQLLHTKISQTYHEGCTVLY